MDGTSKDCQLVVAAHSTTVAVGYAAAYALGMSTPTVGSNIQITGYINSDLYVHNANVPVIIGSILLADCALRR